MTRTVSLLVAVWVALAASAAAQAPTYRMPRTESGHADLQGVWNFSSAVPLQRPPVFAGKKVITKEEFDTQRAMLRNARGWIDKFAPVENVGFDWLDNTPRVEDLRTSLISYPEHGRLPPLVEGVRRTPGPDDFFEALSDPKGGLASLKPLLAAFGARKRDSHADFNLMERCLSSGVEVPFIPQLDGNYVQIIQAGDHVAFVTDVDRRIVTLHSRPPQREPLQSWSGTSRGRWAGDTLVLETRHFNGRVPSFAGASNSLEKVVTERLTRTSDNRIEYAATVIDPKTFTDRIELSFPMTLVDTHIYESGCHEGNYSMRNTLAGARKEEDEAARRQSAPR